MSIITSGSDQPLIFPITYKCNLCCTYCRERFRTTEIDINKSVSVIATFPNEWIFITGGEPLLVPDLISVCDKLKSLGKKIAITTNGTIPNNDLIKHIDRIGISIDGPEDITDSNRGIGTFKKATEYLKSISGVEKGLMCTVGDWNVNRQSEVEDIGRECGCDFVQFNPVN